jgi:hypothetical protein
MIRPQRPNALQYAPSDNSANLPQGEMVDVEDAPNHQCEETCPWVSYHEQRKCQATLKILHTAHA